MLVCIVSVCMLSEMCSAHKTKTSLAKKKQKMGKKKSEQVSKTANWNQERIREIAQWNANKTKYTAEKKKKRTKIRQQSRNKKYGISKGKVKSRSGTENEIEEWKKTQEKSQKVWSVVFSSFHFVVFCFYFEKTFAFLLCFSTFYVRQSIVLFALHGIFFFFFFNFVYVAE